MADDLLSSVACVVELRSTFTPAIPIAPGTLRWIGELGAELDIDVLAYQLTSDHEGDPDAEWQSFM